MIHIGRIRKIFTGKKLLICAWVDDNSALKSKYFTGINTSDGAFITIGKGVDYSGNTLNLTVRGAFCISSFVCIGIGKFRTEKFY